MVVLGDDLPVEMRALLVHVGKDEAKDTTAGVKSVVPEVIEVGDMSGENNVLPGLSDI